MMDILPWVALLCAFWLIYLPRLFVLRAQIKQPGGFDNHYPRDQQATLQGLGKRALGAHQNSIEAFSPFAAGLLACQISGVNSEPIAMWSALFVVARTAYVALYLVDKPTLRSVVWGAGFLATLVLLTLPITR